MESLFELHIQASLLNKTITSFSISLYPKYIKLKEFLNTQQKPINIGILLPEATPLEISFMNWWQSVISPNKKEHSNIFQQTFQAPFPQELMFFIGKIPSFVSFDHSIESSHTTYHEKFYSPKYIFNIADSTITLSSKESGLLIPSTVPHIFHKNFISPLHVIFDNGKTVELFSQNRCTISISENDILIEEIQKEHSLLSKYISTSKIIKSEHITPVFDFSYNSKEKKYELELFLEAKQHNKQLLFPLHLKNAQKFLQSSGQFAVSGDNNTTLIIEPEQIVKKEIKHIVEESFRNFYAVLNEIQENKITTNDKSNLFEKFLPRISNNGKIFQKGKKNKLQFILANEKPDIHISKNSKTPFFGSIDWLSVNFEYNYNNVVLSLSDLEQIILEGFIHKEDNLISISEESLDPIKQLLEFKKNRKNSDIQIHASFLPWLLRIYPDAHIPNEFQELKEFIQFNKIPTISLPEHTPLRDYQKTGVERLALLHKFGFGTILADEMGLGKTLQILALLDLYQQQGKTLIVTPSALLLNWSMEIEKFFPNRFKVIIINGSKKEREEKLTTIKEYDIIITSYHMLSFDLELYQNNDFDFCIIDEAQHIKNYKSKRAKSIKQINAKSKIAVSGTPLENHIAELWSVFDFVMPGFLGSQKDFQKNFTDHLLGFDSQKRKATLEKLSQICNPFIIRRTKNTVYKELPAKIEQTILIELTPKQKTLYIKTLDQVRNQFQSIINEQQFNSQRIDFLSSLTKLRQISLHPQLIYPQLNTEHYDEYSSKMTALFELIEEALENEHRILIFSQFVSMLQIIKQELNNKQISHLYLDGKTPNRVQLTEEFNNSDIPIFLISLRAGGIGLNLTGADTVILFDPWWNPAVEDQAIDRTHRIGQNKTVNIYRLMTKGTIEEKISELQKKKGFLFENLLQENIELGNFSTEELLSLIRSDQE